MTPDQEVVVQFKQCKSSACAKPELPATLDYFYAHKTTRDRLSNLCKSCHRSEMREKARIRYYEITKPFKGHKDRVFKNPRKSEKTPGIENP